MEITNCEQYVVSKLQETEEALYQREAELVKLRDKLESTQFELGRIKNIIANHIGIGDNFISFSNIYKHFDTLEYVEMKEFFDGRS